MQKKATKFKESMKCDIVFLRVLEYNSREYTGMKYVYRRDQKMGVPHTTYLPDDIG